MKIRIVHAADIHLGKAQAGYGEKAAKALVEDRFNSLEKVVECANAKKAHFIVIAGDLFDKTSVAASVIDRAVDILGKAEAQVLVLPGNHDYLPPEGNDLWARFEKKAEKWAQNVHLLVRTQPHEEHVLEQKVVFYPAPCPSKHSTSNCIGWVREEFKDKESLNLGIAHGNVEGYGLDGEGQYFNMTPKELREAGLDAWLLGHIHVPHPKQAQTEHPHFFFPATTASDGFNRKHKGWCWLLEFVGKDRVKMEQVPTGALSFHEWENVELTSMDDIDKLNALVAGQNPMQMLASLKVHGSLAVEEKRRWEELRDRWLNQDFLHFKCEEDGLMEKIDWDFVMLNYPNGSLIHNIFTTLLTDPEGPELAHHTHKLLETLR